MYKGDYGYIRSRRRSSVIRTAVIAGFSLAIFLTGLIIVGNTKNLLSVIAALGAIPTGLSAVNMILFLKAMPLGKEAYEKIKAHEGSLLVLYELIMTSYDKNWNIGAACVLEKNAIFYTEDKNADVAACAAHIKQYLEAQGYGGHVVKVYAPGELDAFVSRLDQLEKLRATLKIDPRAIEDAWQPGTTQTPFGIIRSISL
ncbi:MAG: hypothetical protein K6C95_08010 [Lachnospiraceae bacterium]|nr:hypothetical protein [Lachnospiraceae bacterium]